MYHHQPQQLQLVVTEASSVLQVGDVHDHGAVDPPHSHQHRSPVVVAVGTTHAGFRSSRRPERRPSAAAAAAETETETAARRTQSLVEDYQAPEQVPSLREQR